jgi:hypothetical protein
VTKTREALLSHFPRQTTSYLCQACEHMWDGFTTPCTVHEAWAHYQEHGRSCPQCGAGGVQLLTMYEREQWLAKRAESGPRPAPRRR